MPSPFSPTTSLRSLVIPWLARTFLPAIANALIAAGAFAQSSTRLLTQGDTILGMGGIESFDYMTAQDDGSWYILVDTTFPDPTRDSAVVSGIVPIVKEGSFLSAPPSAAVDEFISFESTPSANLIGILKVSGSSVTTANDQGLYYNLYLARLEGDVSQAPEVSPGTTYKTLFRSSVDTLDDALVLATMDDPAVAGVESAVVLFSNFQTTPQGTATSTEHLLARTGTHIPAGSTNDLTGFASTQRGAFALNARGDYMFIGTFNSDPFDRRVVLNNAIALKETQPVPGPNALGSVVGLDLASVDINDLGDFVIQTNTSVGAALIRGSSLAPAATTKFIQVGDAVPDTSLGNFNLTKIGFKDEPQNVHSWAPAVITNSGDIIWYGEWNDTSAPLRNAGIFINSRLLVRKDASTSSIFQSFGGETCVGTNCGRRIDFRSASFDASPDGRFLLFEAGRNGIVCSGNCTDTEDAVFQMDLGESLPYGTVAQGCTNAYPNPNLNHVSDLVVTGTNQTTGGLPLVGQTFHMTVNSEPPLTTSKTLVFTDNPDPHYPCGTIFPNFEYLLGAGFQSQTPISGIPPLSIPIGPVPSSFLNRVSYAQVFFKNSAGQIIGATNALKLVFGAP